MISKEESSRTRYDAEKKTYFMHYKEVQEDQTVEEFTSDKSVIGKKKLDLLLSGYNYFKSK